MGLCLAGLRELVIAGSANDAIRPQDGASQCRVGVVTPAMDAIGINQVRGLPFKADELLTALIDVITNDGTGNGAQL